MKPAGNFDLIKLLPFYSLFALAPVRPAGRIASGQGFIRLFWNLFLVEIALAVC